MSITLWHYEDHLCLVIMAGQKTCYVKAAEIPLVEDTGINLKSTSPPRFSKTIATKAIRACGKHTHTVIEMHLMFINSNFYCCTLVPDPNLHT